MGQRALEMELANVGSRKGRARSRALAVAATSLFALLQADPAFAQCATTTAGDGTVTIACGNTATTPTNNMNGNNPSTSANGQEFNAPINMTINGGTTISGWGMFLGRNGVVASGTPQPINVVNNGTISHTAAFDSAGQGDDGFGLVLNSNSGSVSYSGNGTVTTNATGGAAVALTLFASGAGHDVTLGSQAAPVGGTFSGEEGILLASQDGATNAWFSGGTITATQANAGRGALSVSGSSGVTLNMTGQTVVNGQVSAGLQTGAGFTAASAVTVTTNAQITNSYAAGAGLSVSSREGGADVTLTSGASINVANVGVLLGAINGQSRFTSAAGTAINQTGNTGALRAGLWFVPSGTGSLLADLSGSIDATGTGILLSTGNGGMNVTIRAGGSVNGDQTGISVNRVNGTTGVVDILNLGTISGATAADFDGTLRIGNGGTTGTITGNIVNRGSLIFNRSDALIYGGAISGTGSLTKQGAGTLTLTGASTFTGGTSVSAGTLLVNGSLTGATNVASGAALGGTGSVGATNVSGTLSPGGDGAIGTLTVNGNLAFAAGSSFRVDIGNGASDRVNVTGTATLAGGVAAFASNSVFTSGSYTLLNAAGGISGTFSPLTTSPNTSGASLRYDGNNVFLDINANPGQTFSFSTRDSLVFNTPTVTTNRINVFSTQIIGRLFGGAPLYDQTFAAAYSSPTVQNALIAARAAITTAGGPGVIIGDPVRVSSSTTSSTTSASTYSLAGPGVVTQNVVATFGPATVQIGALTTCNVSSLPSATRPTCTNGGTSFTVDDATENFNTVTTTTYTINETRTDTITDTLREVYELNGQVAAVGTIHAEVQSGLFDLGSRLLNRLTGPLPANAGWGEVYAYRVSQAGRRDARGPAAGANVTLAQGLTLAFGVDHGDLDIHVPGALEDGDVHLTEGGVALRLERGPFTAALSATYGAGGARTTRTIIGSSAAKYDVQVGGVALELGYKIESNGWTLRPVAGLDYVSVSTDAFTESDTLGLVVGDQDAGRWRASAGLEIGRTFGNVQLAASARYLTVLSGDERVIPVAFAIAPGRVLDMTAPNEPDSALIGARGQVALSPHASLWLAYDGRFGSGYTGHAGTVGVSVAW